MIFLVAVTLGGVLEGECVPDTGGGQMSKCARGAASLASAGKLPPSLKSVPSMGVNKWWWKSSFQEEALLRPPPFRVPYGWLISPLCTNLSWAMVKGSIQIHIVPELCYANIILLSWESANGWQLASKRKLPSKSASREAWNKNDTACRETKRRTPEGVPTELPFSGADFGSELSSEGNFTAKQGTVRFKSPITCLVVRFFLSSMLLAAQLKGNRVAWEEEEVAN